LKQIVANAAVKEVKDGMILGLGSGSTAALMIKSLAEQIRLGKLKNISGVPTSFQSEVLALELNIPLIDLASVSQIDLAIDGADEVDPDFQLIKGGGACHVREKLVASKANKLLIVVDETKLVQNLNQVFPLPVEVLPSAWKQVKDIISEMSGISNLRMALKKAGPVVTDQGNLILDVLFNDGIKDPKDLEMCITGLRTALGSKLFGYADFFSKIIAESCIYALPTSASNFNLEHVRVNKIQK
jgi:ribose 5-phosphate isomerase A